MKMLTTFAGLTVLLLAAPSAGAKELEPIDYGKYFELLPEMKRISEESNQNVRTLHTLMKDLRATPEKQDASALRGQIREILEGHRKLKVRMIEICHAVLEKKPSGRTNVDVLRAVRNTQLRRVQWNEQFLKYVVRDISQATGIPIRLQNTVQELNQVFIRFPEIGAEAALDLICENFDLKWIIYGGEIMIFRKINQNEARFIEYEKKTGRKVDWIEEDKVGTYDSEDERLKAEERKKERELKKLEDVDLPLLAHRMTKLYTLEGESKKHELRLSELKLAAEFIDRMKQGKPLTAEQEKDRIKRHKHVLHYVYMERDNAIEVWDIINQVLGDRIVIPDEDEALRDLLTTPVELIEWRDVDLEDALYELGRIAGVEVDADLPSNVDMKISLTIEKVTVETVLEFICDIHPLDWRFVKGRLVFAYTR